MKFELSPKMSTMASVQNYLPQKYKKYELPGAIPEYTEGPFGSILWQQLKTEYYTICQQQFFIDREIRLYPYAPKPTVSLNCMLRGNLTCILQGVGRVPLIENKFALYYLPAIKHVAFFKKGYYETINFELEEAYVHYFVKDYPNLEPLYEALRQESDTGIQLDSSNINIHIVESITKIRDANPQLPGHRIYVQNRISDIVLQYLQGSQFKNSNQTTSTKERRYALIQEISNYIKGNILSLPPISTIADLNKIHITTLQREFKKHTGTTIHDFINEQKMELAVKLLVETKKSIGNIADTLGYSDSPAFSKSFKARYKLAPGEYRNKWESNATKS